MLPLIYTDFKTNGPEYSRGNLFKKIEQNEFTSPINKTKEYTSQFSKNKQFLKRNLLKSFQSVPNLNISNFKGIPLDYLNSPMNSNLQQTNFNKSNEQIKAEQHEYDEDEKIIKNLQRSREKILMDQQVPNICHKKSVTSFYNHMRKLNVVLQENSYMNIKSTPYTNILYNCEKLNVVPSKVGLIKTEGKEDTIYVKNMRFGDNYMQVLGKAMDGINQIKTYDLSNNRITEKSVKSLLKNILQKAVKLDISNNRIGKTGSQLIYYALINKECKLSILNLEGNQLGSQLLQNVLEQIGTHGGMKILNLSKNNLDDKIAESLKLCLDGCMINELYLYWNQLKSGAGKIIFQFLKDNVYLRVIDLSNNSLGVPGRLGQLLVKTCAHEIAEMFEKNTNLQHIDLSCNQFNYEDTIILAEKLKNNRTIYGIHYEGNHGYVDSQGFLIPVHFQQDLSQVQVRKRIDSINVVQKRNVKNGREQPLKNICWICEGWNEVTFNPKKHVEQESSEVFLYLNYEDYQGIYLGENVESVRKMVPAGIITYFYSNQDEFFIANDSPKQFNPALDNIIYEVLTPEGQKNVFLQEINVEVVSKNFQQFQYGQWQCQTLPRTKNPTYTRVPKKKKKLKWTFPQSLFVKWRPEDAELLTLCFEYDWDCSISIVSKIVKKPHIQGVRQFFRDHYKHIKETYKHYSSFQPVGDVWAIQLHQFQELIEKCNIFDEIFTQTDLSNMWSIVLSGIQEVATTPAFQFYNDPARSNELKELFYNQNFQGLDFINSDIMEDLEYKYTPPLSEQEILKYQVLQLPHPQLKFKTDRDNAWQKAQFHMRNVGNLQLSPSQLKGGQNYRNPEQGLNRYQLIEIITRIAEEKYIIKLKLTQDYPTALKMLWDKHLKQVFTSHNWKLWREDNYWTEHCDLVFKRYKRVIDYVYKENSKKKVKPGQMPFMCLDEFIYIMHESQIIELEYLESYVPQHAFNLAMMTQIDELTQDRTFHMNLYEFYEALARVAEEACLEPGNGIYNHELTMDMKRKQPLYYKLEGLVLQLFKYCTDKNFKKTYTILEKSIFYKDPHESDQEDVKN